MGLESQLAIFDKIADYTGTFKSTEMKVELKNRIRKHCKHYIAGIEENNKEKEIFYGEVVQSTNNWYKQLWGEDILENYMLNHIKNGN